MRQFLLFRLYGPMAAWGEVAVGEMRPSAAHPSKSAVMGLVAAALGIKRHEEEQLQQLESSCGFGVRVDSAGELLRDYHTAQVPPEKRKIRHYTRRDELKSDDLYTILSSRDYRTDSCYSVALWLTSVSCSLGDLQQALLQPKLPLYLGRKSCPLSLPLDPKLIDANDLKGAFDQYDVAADGFVYPVLNRNEPLRYYWEHLDETQAGMRATMRYPRRDLVRSRKRWQFAERDEFFASEQKQGMVL